MTTSTATRTAMGGAIGFAALAALVALGLTREIDLATTIALQSIASPALDLLVNWHTLLGQLVVTLTAAAALAVVCWRRFGGYAWLAPLFILATGAVELVFKLALVHPGPPDEFVRAVMNPLGIRIHAPSSFPSGHLARLTFLAVVAAAMFPGPAISAAGRRLVSTSSLAAAAFVALTLFARVYIGDHWISDALAGLALGVAVGAVAIGWLRAAARR